MQHSMAIIPCSILVFIVAHKSRQRSETISSEKYPGYKTCVNSTRGFLENEKVTFSNASPVSFSQDIPRIRLK